MSAGPIGCLNVERSLGGLDLNRMLLLPRHQGLGLEHARHVRERGLRRHPRSPFIPTHHGRRLFVVTAKPQLYAREIVRHFGLGEFFEAVYGPSEDGVMDDKAELIAHVLRRERCAPGEAAMIGDRSLDVLAARACGVAAIGALWGYGSHAELTEAGAHALAEYPSDVAAALDAAVTRSARVEC